MHVYNYSLILVPKIFTEKTRRSDVRDHLPETYQNCRHYPEGRRTNCRCCLFQPGKIRLARMLEEIGVDQIEVGIPAMGGAEKESIRAIVQCCRRASIMAWNRAVLSDLEHSLDCGVDAVAISIATSDLHIKNKLGKSREWVLESIAAATAFAKKAGLYVSINAEDASRTDLDFLIQFAQTGLGAGADRFRFCDTIGLLNPQTTYERIGPCARLSRNCPSKCIPTMISAWQRPMPWPGWKPVPTMWE